MKKQKKVQPPAVNKLVGRGRKVGLLLGGAALVLVRWSIFTSREALAETKKSTTSATKWPHINWNSLERWVKSELVVLTQRLIRSREA